MSRKILFWASLPLLASPFVSGAMPAAAASAYSQQKPLPGIESASNGHNSIRLADWDVRYRDRDEDRQRDYDRYRRERERNWERWHRNRDREDWHRDNDWSRQNRDYDWYHH
ncbi:MAG: hypothetical protein JO235_11745 [Chroococcidiopsidaceae cyanobacterium CP_BM_RX_35]|nr:hypothetical protein [Chroococcidiopsidaceae cyanobacterium CP_BM_RX_35]